MHACVPRAVCLWSSLLGAVRGKPAAKRHLGAALGSLLLAPVLALGRILCDTLVQLLVAPPGLVVVAHRGCSGCVPETQFGCMAATASWRCGDCCDRRCWRQLAFTICVELCNALRGRTELNCVAACSANARRSTAELVRKRVQLSLWLTDCLNSHVNLVTVPRWCSH